MFAQFATSTATTNLSPKPVPKLIGGFTRDVCECVCVYVCVCARVCAVKERFPELDTCTKVLRNVTDVTNVLNLSLTNFE